MENGYSVLHRFYIEISPDLFEIWPDFVEIYRDLFKIRPNLVEIRQDLFKISSDLAKTRDLGEIRRRFLQNLMRFTQFETDRYPTGEPLTSNHPNHCHRRVGSGFRFRRLDLVGSIPGWAQTRPGLTRGHPYTHPSFRERATNP